MTARAPGLAARRRPLVGPVTSRRRTDCHSRPLEIAYRVGDYATFLTDLIEHVRTEVIPEGEFAGVPPLAKLDIEAYHEWTVGLFKAWAEVGDILSFYQERIANEGFLATAREERSIREITRLIDHVPAPGIASSTRLAYTLRELAGTPNVVVIPERASVTSVPERKESPQTWETVEELHARVAWNAIKPFVSSIELQPSLAPAATSLDLEGVELGLDVGSPLLIEVSDAGGAAPAFRRVVEVEEIDAEEAGGVALTRVGFDRPLAPEPSSESPVAALRIAAVSTFEQDLAVFGSNAPDWSELEDEVKALYTPPLGGVVVSDSEGEWASRNIGLPEDPVAAVLAGPDGSLYVGTSNGVFRSIDGESWSRSGADLIGNEILDLATDGQQLLYAGTAKNGVLRSSDGETWEVLLGESVREPLVPLGRGRLPRSGRLPLCPVRAVLPSGDRVFAGTDHGVFVFAPQSDAWEAVNKGLPGWAAKTGRAGIVIQVLVVGAGRGELYAGTDQGVFHTSNHGRTWQPRNTGLPEHDPESGGAKVSVLSLHLRQDRRTRTTILMAATDLGIFRSLDGGASWETASLGLPATDVDTGLSETQVSALAVAVDPTTLETCCYAATSEGLFVSTDVGIYWAAAGDEVVSRPVSALATSLGGGLVAAVPRGGFDRERWPHFRIRDGQLDLLDAVPGIAEGDWLVLVDPGDADDPQAERVEVLRAGRVRQLVRDDYGVEAGVTRVTAARPIEGQVRFGLRTTRALAGSRPLQLPIGHRTLLGPLPTEVIELDPDQELRRFPGPHNVVVDGKPLRVRLSGVEKLRTDDGREYPIEEQDEPRVLRSSPVAGDRLRLRLRLESEAEGDLTLAAADIVWRPARAEDPAVAEDATAEWIEPAAGAGRPALSLHPALDRCYDPTTVRILGNVAQATQGKTVYREVLGSGDATLDHQRFPIQAPPLAYLRTASARGWASTLEIRVNGVLWCEVESLFEAQPRDRVYMIRHDLEGVATIIFGDGEHGARLPTGQKNIVALYRRGLWLEGVNRGRVSVAETKPLGVDGVTNPRRAVAGARPETPDQTRRRVPVSLRTLGRIVSLQDYEDFCRAYPGIAQARVANLATNSGNVVQVTIATDDGVPVRAGDDFHQALTATVDAARAGRTALSIDFCRRVAFDVSARVRFEIDRRAADVERAVRRLMLATYTYDRACFESRVTASELVRRIGSVSGVVSVRLERFHRSALQPAAEAFLEARPARWDARARTIRGAELLELRRPGGLVLNMVAAR